MTILKGILNSLDSAKATEIQAHQVKVIALKGEKEATLTSINLDLAADLAPSERQEVAERCVQAQALVE